VGQETAARIRKLAEKRNYRPDAGARSMRSGRYHNIGYFQANRNRISWTVRGLEPAILDVAAENQYRVVLVQMPSDRKANPSFVPGAFREGNLDAMIISGREALSSEVTKAIDRSRFPIVYLDEKQAHNAVYVNEQASAEELTRYLISQGHRRIAYIDAYGRSHYSGKDRRRGYQKAMKGGGLETSILDLHEEYPKDYEKLTRWLSAHPETEAVIAYNDLTAIQLYHVFYNELGKPKELAIASIGDDMVMPFSPVPVTVMQIPFYEMGRAAAEMALKLVETNQKFIPSQIFQAKLIVRDSTFQRKKR
jgi:DNA-binding LacI/PurR family transcriptional regulator